jgi:hypothetical protein
MSASENQFSLIRAAPTEGQRGNNELAASIIQNLSYELF